MRLHCWNRVQTFTDAQESTMDFGQCNEEGAAASRAPEHSSQATNMYTRDTPWAETFGDDPGDLSMTLWDMFTLTASRYPDREAVISMWQSKSTNPTQTPPHSPFVSTDGLRWTYNDLACTSSLLAASLARLGCKRNMTLAVLLWNSAEWALCFWAATKIGITFAPVDPRNASEATTMLDILKPDVIVVQDEDGAAIASSYSSNSLGPNIRLICAEDYLDGWLSVRSLLYAADLVPSPVEVDQHPAEPVEDEVEHGDAVLVVFTSGTTGPSKGCVHTNRNLISQACDYDASEDPEVIDKWLVHTPVSHIFAANNALRAWKTGGTVVFPSKSFEIDSSLRALQHEKCTIMSATPTLVKALLSNTAFSSDATAALSLISIAATTVRLDDLRMCRQLGAKDAIQAYGMSEGAPLISWSRQDKLLVDGYHKGVGKVLPGAAVRICDPESRRVLLRAELGELHVSGSSVISRYLNNVGANSFYDDDSGRWLMTGDMATMDENGVLCILGRYKDLIIRGGENINPVKLETALAELGVDANIVGIPDAVAGEAPVAVVKHLSSMTRSQLKTHARALGPKYALNGVFTLEELQLDTFPTTASGKVKKDFLRAAVQKLLSNESLPVVKGEDVSCRAVSPKTTGELSECLARVWAEMTGIQAGHADGLMHMADSITLLQYCDAVSQSCGARLHLQDVLNNDTIERQAQILQARILQSSHSDGGSKRKFLTEHHPVSTARQIKSHGLRLSNATARPAYINTAHAVLMKLGLENTSIEGILPIRESFRRLVRGLRSESFHIRIAFRVLDVTTQRIQQALEKSLVAKPLFRAFSFSDDHGGLSHATLQASQSLFERLVVRTNVESDLEAERIWQDDTTASRIFPFVFEAEIIKIHDSENHYLSLTLNHAVVDALSLMSWQRDVDNLINDLEAQNPPGTSFETFSDLFSQYDKSLPAQKAVSFHVQRLRGISRLSKSLWPLQRAPGWMVSYDENSPLGKERGSIRQDVWNGEWDSKASMFRFPRIGRVVHLPTLSRLKHAGIEPSLFTKAAISIFNVLQTGTSHAIFNVWESGRSWPFVPSWMDEMLPPAMSIDGPTCQWLLTMTEVKSEEPVLEFLRRLSAEYEELKRFEHVPWDQVVAELRDEGDTATNASYRQSFVWDVTLGMAASSGLRNGPKKLEAIARFDWPDCGLFWNAFTVDPDSILFVASWDTAQMNDLEIESYCNMLAEVMRNLAHEGNWSRPIGEVFERHGGRC